MLEIWITITGVIIMIRRMKLVVILIGLCVSGTATGREAGRGRLPSEEPQALVVNLAVLVKQLPGCHTIRAGPVEKDFLVP